MTARPFGPLPEQAKHEWVYLEPAKGWGPKSIAYFRCTRCHIKRLRTASSIDRATDVCHVVAYADRNRAAARERQRRLREEGTCVACGTRGAVDGAGGRCDECRDERRVTP
jgi:hypothetical protein